ncbi:dethiobiotin synthase [Parafrankia sp. BMG5.11]|uniref:dethiobiotin synthase n=1 Tax=Parafrankia sp. BMG5.11 TaxID=222540 RepID=UPI00103D29CF|nr:dethiobiotin synthase [Parafrankia sp. BMG5.11]TCJ31552.1 ATP-dependent dethiobiotin synthetase BioD [Parafrankia sp. BMG5.11]
MSLLIVTGTGTDVGKTVVTAAVAALALAAGESVAVLKPVQTGTRTATETDIEVVSRLVGPAADCVVLGSYPEPLAPNTAARRAVMPATPPSAAVEEARRLADGHSRVLVEGAGGVLARFDDAGGTLLDVAAALNAPILVVAAAGLGTLNATALTTEAIRRRGLSCVGLVIGSWPADPDLAMRCNINDLRDVAETELVGAVPAGSGALDPQRFRRTARASLAPALGGTWDVAEFVVRHAAPAAA